MTGCLGRVVVDDGQSPGLEGPWLKLSLWSKTQRCYPSLVSLGTWRLVGSINFLLGLRTSLGTELEVCRLGVPRRWWGM